MAKQIPQDVAVENREVLSAPNVPKEVTRLLPAEPVDFADEPGACCLRVREAVQGLAEDGPVWRKEPFSSPHDVGRLVVVKPRARPQERRDVALAARPEKVVCYQITNRGIRPVGFRLQRENAETQFLEKAFVGKASHPSEVRQSRENHLPFPGVLGLQGGEVAITRHGPRKTDG